MSANYCDILLPLPLEGTFTYLLPPELSDKAGVGQRAVVPFGKSKQYSGIIMGIHQRKPQGDFQIKSILDIIDERPILTSQQLQLWQWMADYYMCSLGDVYKAAMPSGLRPTSEMFILPNDDFSDLHLLRPKELQALELLRSGKVKTVATLARALKVGSALNHVRSLMEHGAITVSEHIEGRYKPKTETRIRLAEAYLSEEALSQLLQLLQRTPKRLQLFQTYMELSGLKAAITLHNPQLLGEVSKAALLRESGTSAAVLIALKAKGILEFYESTVEPQPSEALPIEDQLPLSEAQQQAYDAILQRFQQKPVCLLHGVTSSGKTEIYIRLIRSMIKAGKQVLYLLPEIALTTQITHRLRRVFGNEMGVYHSQFPDSQRVALWQRQLSDHPYGLLLGVRSSVFLPFQHLGLVIVDEEHEPSYKQEDPAPRYHARDTAIMLATRHGARALLGTATPNLETYANAQQGKYGYVQLTTRYGAVSMPKIEVADVCRLMHTKEMRPPFSPRLEQAIDEALHNDQQVILFQNRRGYAPVVECQQCGWTPTCPHCDVTLTFHQSLHRMECHYCGSSFDLPQECPACGGQQLRPLGYGTEKIEEEVRKRFPAARTARLDLDTASSRQAYESILSRFSSGETNVLIGTQMISKGLDFARVQVVGILGIDALLTRPDFRSFERSFQLMAQVAGRAGRRSGQGHVVLQTRHAEYSVIKQVVADDYVGMFHEQMEERSAFHYPPFTRLIYVYLKHRDQPSVISSAEALAQSLRAVFGTAVLGPEAPSVARVQRLHIRKIALKLPRSLSPTWVRAELRRILSTVQSLPSYGPLQVYFDVDPL